jgi:hypothetical protein
VDSLRLGQFGGFFDPFDEVYIAREWSARACSFHSHPDRGFGPATLESQPVSFHSARVGAGMLVSGMGGSFQSLEIPA